MKTIKQFELLLHEDRTPYLEKVLDVHADADGSYNDPGEIARLKSTCGSLVLMHSSIVLGCLKLVAEALISVSCRRHPLSRERF